MDISTHSALNDSILSGNREQSNVATIGVAAPQNST